MNNDVLYSALALLLIFSLSANNANAEADQVELYKSSGFALGIGIAVVRFDTNIKVFDKENERTTYLDLEGNLDLPDVSTVTTFYGGY